MNKISKVCGVAVAVMLAGSVGMAQYHGGGHYDSGRSYHYDGGRSYHYDGSRHYGYYHNSRGEWVFGVLGLGLLTAAVMADHPVYVQQPVVVQQSPQVVYVQQPAVVQQPAPVVYMQQPAVIQQQIQVVSPQPVTTTINIQNSNGSFTPVTLRAVGGNWVGPKGEYYDTMPSVGQLRPVYGF